MVNFFSFTSTLITTDKETAKKKRLSKYTEPTRYWYKPRKFPLSDTLGSHQKRQFNWFLGGIDSCFGDSGGPLWRNINVASRTFQKKSNFSIQYKFR